nr:replication-associated protein B [Mute swan feces associated gemycircularvirus 1]
MSSSPTHNAPSSIPGELWNAFHLWELSASSEESCTRMEDFIFTCSQTSDGSFEAERLTFSMWTVGTQTLSLLREHLRRATTTRSRMAMLSAEGWDGRNRAEWELGRLLTSGLELRKRRIETNFGLFAMNWIPKLLHAVSTHSASMLTGDLPRSLPSMSTHEDLTLFLAMLTEEMRGYRSLVSDWNSHN